MTTWILAVCALWFAQIFFAASYKTVLAGDPQAAVVDHMKGKDKAPEPSLMGKRAARAQANMAESLPVFFALALLLELKGAPGLAVPGAITFLVARTLYVPAYMLAVFGLRTVMWAGGVAGLGMMAWAAYSG